MGDLLASAYPVIKALHIMAVISWMAGLFYLPRIFVYHAERASVGSELSETFKIMERKLLKFIINPASIAVWGFGLLMVLTPGLIDFSEFWVWVKLCGIVGMSWFHHKLVHWQRAFAEDRNTQTGRYFRLMNEVPTVLMIVIVLMVVLKPF